MNTSSTTPTEFHKQNIGFSEQDDFDDNVHPAMKHAMGGVITTKHLETISKIESKKQSKVPLEQDLEQASEENEAKSFGDLIKDLGKNIEMKVEDTIGDPTSPLAFHHHTLSDERKIASSDPNNLPNMVTPGKFAVYLQYIRTQPIENVASIDQRLNILTKVCQFDTSLDPPTLQDSKNASLSEKDKQDYYVNLVDDLTYYYNVPHIIQRGKKSYFGFWHAIDEDKLYTKEEREILENNKSLKSEAHIPEFI